MTMCCSASLGSAGMLPSAVGPSKGNVTVFARSGPSTSMVNFNALPPVGSPLGAGVFVGVMTQPTGRHVAVILLPDRAHDVSWDAAIQWAKQLDAQLPTRAMAALIFANTTMRPQAQRQWTCEEFRAHSNYAWNCNYCYGTQDRILKSNKACAVAVHLLGLHG